MSDLLDDDGPGGGPSNLPELTVSELSASVKRAIEGGFSRVRVRGEIGRVSRPRSGHVYLDLKDERAVLSGVVWKGQAGRLSVQPSEGDEVIATGRLTTFPGQSKYQIVIEDMTLAGEGALLAKLERLRKALAAEGLFAEERKRPLPFLPELVGVVTSPTGAVIRDILHRLADRFPRRVIVWPVAVQGERSAPEVARAIRGFSALPPGHPLRPDVLIVARGGGSVEDLWGFNEEAVVRAAAECSIPLISAVGHETDTTLIDFAADRRAPTPTAAAELAVPVRADLSAQLSDLENRRRRAAARRLSDENRRLRDLARALPRPEQMLAERAQRLDALAGRLPRALGALATAKRAAAARGPAARFGPGLLAQLLRLRRARLRGLADRLSPARLAAETRRRREALTPLARRLDRAGGAIPSEARTRLDRAGRLLETLSYKDTLRRGFAVVRQDGAVVARAAGLDAGRPAEIEFHDARVAVGDGPATADGATETTPPPRRRKREIPNDDPDDPQGSLL
ncbi:MAG TPA: exodeoxyribonuclease VII large subunit [Paracoccaceae bacterium]|nr:exodeoxyribonuclease VII large subunit [Paracoccaceae bacterium]